MKIIEEGYVLFHLAVVNTKDLEEVVKSQV